MASPDAIVASLLHDLVGHDHRLLLVLDDFHLVHDDGVHRKLEWLIGAPAGQHRPGDRQPHPPAAVAEPVAAARRAARTGRLALRPRPRRGRRLRRPRQRRAAGAQPARDPARAHRRLDRRPAAGLAGAARERRPGRLPGRLLGLRPRHHRLPRRAGARQPAARAARLPARHRRPRPLLRRALRRGAAAPRQPRDAGRDPGPQPVPVGPRPLAHLVPLPPPVRRLPARAQPRAARRCGARDLPARERLVQPPPAAARGGALCLRRAGHSSAPPTWWPSSRPSWCSIAASTPPCSAGSRGCRRRSIHARPEDPHRPRLVAGAHPPPRRSRPGTARAGSRLRGRWRRRQRRRALHGRDDPLRLLRAVRPAPAGQVARAKPGCAPGRGPRPSAPAWWPTCWPAGCSRHRRLRAGAAGPGAGAPRLRGMRRRTTAWPGPAPWRW